MKNSHSKIELLNAYVDGELSPKEAACVAEEVASDPEIGRIVARLHGLKSAVSESFDSPSQIMLVGQTSSRTATVFGSAAAAILLIVIGAWFSQNYYRENSLLIEALLKHDAWVTESQSKFTLAKISSGLVIPDLTPAGLELMAFEPRFDLGNYSASRLAFVGKRGCQLSLFLIRGKSVNLPTANQKSLSALVEHWSFGDNSYLLVSRKMDENRFNVIAKALKSSTLLSMPIDEKMRLALSNARQPCRV